MISSKFDAAAAQRTEIPAAARIAEVQVAGQDPAVAVERHDGVLHVDVEDPVGELADESGRIDPLPDQVAGIEIEAELRPMVQRFEGPLGRVAGRRRSPSGWTSRANFTPHSANTSRIGFNRSASSLNPSSIIAGGTGGKE